MEKLLFYFYYYYNYLKHLIGHQLETLHLSFNWSIYSINIITDLLYLIKKNWQRKRKWLVFPVSVPQWHMGLTLSLKLWRNLCSLTWLNCRRSIVSNLTPTGSCIKNSDLCFKEKMVFSIHLNYLIHSVSCIVLSNLLHFLTKKGKKEVLNLSVLQENSCKLF